MDAQVNKPLVDALITREREYREAIDRAREATGDDTGAANALRLLREAVELTRCLRRLIPAQTVNDIHAAFGAPGDFGYETPIGDALSRLYRGEP